MAFFLNQKILFKHCDPAGIVFYPRYFEIMNDCVEAFFDSELEWPFEELHKSGGIPTAAISTSFKAPSRHGDLLAVSLQPSRIGTTSLDLTTRATCEGELRFETQSTLVKVDLSGQPSKWPDNVRTKLEKMMEGQHVN